MVVVVVVMMAMPMLVAAVSRDGNEEWLLSRSLPHDEELNDGVDEDDCCEADAEDEEDVKGCCQSGCCCGDCDVCRPKRND